MALYHLATSTPTKAELLAEWIPTQPWAPAGATDADIETIGAFRFDDPEGQVGLESHVVRVGQVLAFCPVTYRDAPLDDGSADLIATMEHSALGTRWVYDAVTDHRYVSVLAGAALTDQGEALGFAEAQGRLYVAPSEISIRGGGWGTDPVAVDGFERVASDADVAVLRNDRFELTVHRLPIATERPPMGLTATLPGQSEPVLVATVREL